MLIYEFTWLANILSISEQKNDQRTFKYHLSIQTVMFQSI